MKPPKKWERDSVVQTYAVQEVVGPYPNYTGCSLERNASIDRGFRVTPCFRDPQGWFFQRY